MNDTPPLGACSSGPTSQIIGVAEVSATLEDLAHLFDAIEVLALVKGDDAALSLAQRLYDHLRPNLAQRPTRWEMVVTFGFDADDLAAIVKAVEADIIRRKINRSPRKQAVARVCGQLPEPDGGWHRWSGIKVTK